MRHLGAALIAAAALAPAGCCTLARVACDWPLPKSPPRGNRDTPDAALDHLVDAFRNGRVLDVFDSFHPAFVVENGEFSAQEFAAAYHRYEADFAADGQSMAAAERKIGDAAGGVVVVELTNPASGAYLPITLENRPKIRVFTKDPFVGTIEGAVDMRALVRLEDGRLSLPASFALTSIENVAPETVKGLVSSDVLRVEFSQDWLVRSIDPGRSRNIRFVDRIKEHMTQ